jgi:hypothetical protein
MGLWRGKDRSIEERLRAARPEADDRFVDGLANKVEASGSPRRAWSRVAFVSGLAVFMLGSFASFGGLGYASSGVISSAKVVKHVVVPVKHRVTVRVTYTSAADQYSHTKTVVKTVTKPTVKAKVIGIKTTIKPSANVAGKTLPFTGFSLGGTVVLGLALIGLGVFLRRRERHEQ